MRYTLSFLIAFLVAAAGVDVYAQSFPADGRSTDPESDQTDVVPGEILVRFEDEVQVIGNKKGGIEVGRTAVDTVFRDVKVTSSEALFPNAESLPKSARQQFETYSGHTVERPSLHNIYRVSIEDPARQPEVIRQLKQREAVVYAEPNYVYEVVGTSSSMKLDSAAASRTQETASASLPPNDPMYSEQKHITATNIDDVWADTTGSSEHAIAVLDTGVDMDHPDLTNKIWTNTAEANGTEGVDDDGNGYVDDVYGWDFINNDADPADDNSHGTHVAGIAAAEANNGIGIAGVNWQARVMPIKILQSSGRGDVATIVQGIQYAAEMGADVLNMSFGSYARSLTMENALAGAYTDAFLVGAAGNDNACIGPPTPIPCRGPFFPAAITYVLGVEASAVWSNYDQDGSVFSEYAELWNYELQAPGSSILSSIPGGNYREYSGTSMSAPVVSGVVSLYRALFPDQSQELAWGNLINTRSGHIDLAAATSVQPEPDLRFVTRSVVDTLGDGDGNVDAGETIELWFEALNSWGQADSVAVGLEFGEFEDQSVATIQKDSAFIGSVSAYARRTNEENPFEIHLSSDLSHDRDIVFNSKIYSEANEDTTEKQIILTVENANELSGVMDSTLVLTSDNLWVVNNSFRVGSSATLQIESGTELILDHPIVNKGTVESNGKKADRVEIKGPESIVGEGDASYNYTTFSGIKDAFGGLGYGTLEFTNCIFKGIDAIDVSFTDGYGLFRGRNLYVSNSTIKNSYMNRLFSYGYNSLQFTNNNVWNSLANNSLSITVDTDIGNISHNNFVGIGSYYYERYGNDAKSALLPANISFSGNSFITFTEKSFAVYTSGNGGDITSLEDQYWGSTDTTHIEQEVVYDFWNDPTLPMVDFSPMLESPSSEAHGLVWKVLVNGTDPRSEEMDPVGVGPVRFDVHFNRPMDTQYDPQLTFGVRQPYTQNVAADSTHWSADSTQWTAYANVDLNTGDGINRIRVDEARDPEDFKIPVEDERFEFVIDAAGSVSQDFIADAGLGEIDLRWPPPEKEDLLGYNVYRFENETDSTYTDTTRINNELVTDTTYTDFDVEPDSNYYYQYTVVNTDLSESDKSQVAAAEVLTADPGDANGDQTVNVLDVTTTTAHILDQGPEPFIFDAADTNEDGTVNVLDVVGIVDLVLGSSQSEKALADAPATLRTKEDRLILETSTAVGGMQLDLAGVSSDEVRALEVPDGIEVSRAETAGDTLSVLMYGMGGATIPAGKRPLLALDDSASIGSAVLSDPYGNAIETAIPSAEEDLPEEFVLEGNYPNPVQQSTTIPYELKTDVERVSVTVYDILGRRVATLRPEARTAGRHELRFRAIRLASGVYFYRMSVTTPDGSRRQVGTEKMVVVR